MAFWKFPKFPKRKVDNVFIVRQLKEEWTERYAFILDQTATIFVLNAKQAGSAAAALFSPNVDSDRSTTMAIISALELWCVTLHSLSCVLSQSRLPVLQPGVLQRQSVIESRVKIASSKLFSVAILYRGVGCTDESRAPDLTISRSETPLPEAKFFVCVGEYQHEQGTPAWGLHHWDRFWLGSW